MFKNIFWVGKNAVPYPAEHKFRTRARIVESARRLFNRHGFEQVSIDQIMAGAGLTRGGFYHHFGSKDELFAARSAVSRRVTRSRLMRRRLNRRSPIPASWRAC